MGKDFYMMFILHKPTSDLTFKILGGLLHYINIIKKFLKSIFVI